LWMPAESSVGDLRTSGIDCVLRAYVDESYDSKTMCVGGWLCHEASWKLIEPKVGQRIEYERRRSIRRGELPISRYHATDCANLKKEFSERNGWDIPRQIQLTKRLIDILASVSPRPVGIAVGLTLDDLRAARPDLNEEMTKWVAYFLCMCECFLNLGEVLDAASPTERVTVIHEHSPHFNSAALAAYNQMFESKKFPYARYFVSIMPGRWQDFPALQPADLLAYEGFKLTAARKRGRDDLRKSLQAVIGHGIDIRAGFYKSHGLKELTGG